jgi:hypothetical protein
MTIDEIKAKLKTSEYDFLRENEHLKDNVILLGLGGSHAYGTENENSDLDIRGCALNSKQEILLGRDFGQVVDVATDTTIYSFNKLVTLLINVNPNTIELLGMKPAQYLYVSPIGQELLDNRKMFLSKKCVYSFGGYANQQLYRLRQKSAHAMGQADLERHILKTLEHMQTNFNSVYSQMPDDSIKLYIDDSAREGYDTEIYMDVQLTHYPLRDYCNLWNELQNTVHQYNKIGKRNENAITHNKIAKHSMHLIRLYLMCLDLLENGEIVTYREKEHELLMNIRNGKYIDSNNEVADEFYDIVEEYEKRMEYAVKNTELPDEPDYRAIDEFVADVNERVVRKQRI